MMRREAAQATSRSSFADHEPTAMARGWKTQCASARREAGVTKDFAGWTTRQGIRLLGVPRTLRTVEIVDAMWALQFHRIKSAPTLTTLELRKLWVDVSQNIGRGKAVTGAGFVGADDIVH